MSRDPKQDPYYNPDFSPEVNEVTNDFTYKKFNKKQITGDAVIIKMNDGMKDFDVLLIQRKRGPHQNGYALPGGIYEEGMDTIEDFIGREALEEVGLQTTDIVDSYDLSPKLNRFDWDARAGKGVDVYGKVFVVDSNFIPIASDDALSAKFVNIKQITNKNIDLAFGHAEWILDSYKGKDGLQGQGFNDTNKNKLFDIVEENTKRNQEFIVEVNKKRESDNFNAIDLSQDTNIRNTFDAEFETNFPPDQFEGEGPIETTPFDEHMAATTDAEIAEWYGEKYGKDYITDTKTMTSSQINNINTEFKTDVAKSFVDDTDEVALSAREWLNENTSRGVDPTAQMDDTLKALEQSNADMFPDEVIDTIDNIPDDIVIDTPNAPLKGNQLKQVLKNRLKKLAIGGLNYLDMYELGLIGYAVAEPAAQKLLEPIMPYIVPGYKAPKNNESYKDQVIANLQETAKISPTAKLVENMPEKTEYEKLDNLGYGWLGKMLDR